ncbi:Alcohol dehydrogenase 1 [Dendrobium catenatum]|uniref:alcohol dehydrogenase n=1 Tax=Dendrobium catenatum TaxID=906689 RepID=A0A2I0W7Y1_9ASPA|nr:Alcohol dehydrogenase 1 [Dendrobium catenatum]
MSSNRHRIVDVDSSSPLWSGVIWYQSRQVAGVLVRRRVASVADDIWRRPVFGGKIASVENRSRWKKESSKETRKDIKNNIFDHHLFVLIYQEEAKLLPLLSYTRMDVLSDSCCTPCLPASQLEPRDSGLEGGRTVVYSLADCFIQKVSTHTVQSKWTDASTPQGVNGFRPWDKYAPMTASRSFVPTESLRTDDDDEGILDGQISSTPPSIEFSFKEFKDPLPKSSSLPLYDEPVYDVYDDDMFGGVLDLEKPIDDKDEKSKPIQEVIAEKNNGGVDRSVECSGNVDTMISAFESVHDGWGVTELKEGDHVLPIFTA